MLPKSLWRSFGGARLLTSRVFPRQFRLAGTLAPPDLDFGQHAPWRRWKPSFPARFALVKTSGIFSTADGRGSNPRTRNPKRQIRIKPLLHADLSSEAEQRRMDQCWFVQTSGSASASPLRRAFCPGKFALPECVVVHRLVCGLDMTGSALVSFPISGHSFNSLLFK